MRFTPSPGAAAVLVTAPVKPSRAPQIEDELIALGVTVVFDSQERVKQERYRGSTYDTTVTELHVATIATPDQLDAVVGVLSAHGMTLTFAEVDRATITPDRATDGPGPDDTSTGAPSDATAPVRVVARP